MAKIINTILLSTSILMLGYSNVYSSEYKKELYDCINCNANDMKNMNINTEQYSMKDKKPHEHNNYGKLYYIKNDKRVYPIDSNGRYFYDLQTMISISHKTDNNDYIIPNLSGGMNLVIQSFLGKNNFCKLYNPNSTDMESLVNVNIPSNTNLIIPEDVILNTNKITLKFGDKSENNMLLVLGKITTDADTTNECISFTSNENVNKNRSIIFGPKSIVKNGKSQDKIIISSLNDGSIEYILYPGCEVGDPATINAMTRELDKVKNCLFNGSGNIYLNRFNDDLSDPDTINCKKLKGLINKNCKTIYSKSAKNNINKMANKLTDNGKYTNNKITPFSNLYSNSSSGSSSFIDPDIPLSFVDDGTGKEVLSLNPQNKFAKYDVKYCDKFSVHDYNYGFNKLYNIEDSIDKYINVNTIEDLFYNGKGLLNEFLKSENTHAINELYYNIKQPIHTFLTYISEILKQFIIKNLDTVISNYLPVAIQTIMNASTFITHNLLPAIDKFYNGKSKVSDFISESIEQIFHNVRTFFLEQYERKTARNEESPIGTPLAHILFVPIIDQKDVNKEINAKLYGTIMDLLKNLQMLVNSNFHFIDNININWLKQLLENVRDSLDNFLDSIPVSKNTSLKQVLYKFIKEYGKKKSNKGILDNVLDHIFCPTHYLRMKPLKFGKGDVINIAPFKNIGDNFITLKLYLTPPDCTIPLLETKIKRELLEPFNFNNIIDLESLCTGKDGTSIFDYFKEQIDKSTLSTDCCNKLQLIREIEDSSNPKEKIEEKITALKTEKKQDEMLELMQDLKRKKRNTLQARSDIIERKNQVLENIEYNLQQLFDDIQYLIEDLLMSNINLDALFKHLLHPFDGVFSGKVKYNKIYPGLIGDKPIIISSNATDMHLYGDNSYFNNRIFLSNTNHLNTLHLYNSNSMVNIENVNTLNLCANNYIVWDLAKLNNEVNFNLINKDYNTCYLQFIDNSIFKKKDTIKFSGNNSNYKINNNSGIVYIPSTVKNLIFAKPESKVLVSRRKYVYTGINNNNTLDLIKDISGDGIQNICAGENSIPLNKNSKGWNKFFTNNDGMVIKNISKVKHLGLYNKSGIIWNTNTLKQCFSDGDKLLHSMPSIINADLIGSEPITINNTNNIVKILGNTSKYNGDITIPSTVTDLYISSNLLDKIIHNEDEKLCKLRIHFTSPTKENKTSHRHKKHFNEISTCECSDFDIFNKDKNHKHFCDLSNGPEEFKMCEEKHGKHYKEDYDNNYIYELCSDGRIIKYNKY